MHLHPKYRQELPRHLSQFVMRRKSLLSSACKSSTRCARQSPDSAKIFNFYFRAPARAISVKDRKPAPTIEDDNNDNILEKAHEYTCL